MRFVVGSDWLEKESKVEMMTARFRVSLTGEIASLALH